MYNVIEPVIKTETALTFDDIQILPGYSEVESRTHCQVSAQFTRHYRIPIPIVAAPMDTVCGREMSIALGKRGGAGCLHRFMVLDDQVTDIKVIRGALGPDAVVVSSIGATSDFKSRTKHSLAAGANVILIDVAHGDHVHVKRALAWLNSLEERVTFDVIAGNIATYDAALRLQDWGADALRVGIGGGSMCTTRVNTGVGVPQLTALAEIVNAGVDIPIISDGGIRYPGDAAKALAMGADTVMLGGMLAGTTQAPGAVITTGNWPHEKRVKLFRGSASASAKQDVLGEIKHVEGASRMVDAKGDVNEVIEHMLDGIRSAMSYVGAANLEEFRAKAKFVRITQAGQVEAHPHGMR